MTNGDDLTSYFLHKSSFCQKMKIEICLLKVMMAKMAIYCWKNDAKSRKNDNYEN